MLRRRLSVLVLSCVLGGAMLGPGCRRSPATEPAPMVERVAWDAPGISAAAPGSAARYAVRDGHVSAAFTDGGFALGLGLGPEAPELRWTLSGARAVRPRPDGELPGRVSHLQGDPSDWRAGMPTYGRLVYSDVYPGVTLSLETRRHALAYRFDVAPGGDAASIRMRYAGADLVDIRDQGKSLDIRYGRSSLRESGLRCFQGEGEAERTEVPCRYAPVKGDEAEITIALGAYDRSKALIIDPEIGWGSFLGGNSIDYGRSLAVDPSGNIYVAGYTSSKDFPTKGGFDSTVDGFFDAYVTKISPGGTSIVWSSVLGGTSDEYGYGVAVDSGGNAFVVGYTYSTDFPTAGGFDTTHGGSSDAFIAKVSAAGSSLQWSSYLGGTSGDEAYSVAVDSSGDAYVAGNTYSGDFPANGGFDTTHGGSTDAFVAKVDSSGSGLVWSSYLGGSSSDYCYAVAVDAAGAAHLTGYTYSADFPTNNGFDVAFAGGSDAYVAKVDPAGDTLAWSSYLGGVSSDQGQGIAVDSQGNVYLAGNTSSSDFPTTGGFDDTVSGTDGFVIKIDSTPSVVWSTYLGGVSTDYGYAIAVDSTGAPVVVGYTFSEDFPITDAFNPAIGGSLDGFVAKVDPTGATLTWSSYLGGQSSDYAYGLAVDKDDNVIVTGYTYSTDFPVRGGFDTTVASLPDAYVTYVVVCGNGNCDVGEDECNCPDDCGADTCGNGCCGPTEGPCVCEEDCPDLCGNGCCGSDEDECSCPDDCGADTCGNGCCGDEESACSCGADCADLCGDGCCTGGENPCGCPADCGPDTCGSDCCGPGESACSCEQDCLSLCGDGCCTGQETCATCDDDCGACVESGADGGTDGESSDGCGCFVGRASRGLPPALLLPLLLWRRRRKR